MVNYTLKQLYSFEAVVRLKSFSKAAKELNITQPAVYMQVKQLQDNISSDIILVNGKKISTTFVGEKLLLTSKNIIAELEKSKQDIAQTLDPDSGHLNIAVATTANSFVSGILAEFKAQNPKITFYLQVLNRVELLNKIKTRQDDIIIMGEPPENIESKSEVFKQNPLIAICHPKHKLLKKKNATIDDLRNEVLITREKGSGTRNTIERITGLDFNSDIEINSNEAITHSVRAGLGIGFVSELTVELELKTGMVSKLDLKDFPIIRNWHIVYCNKNISKISKKFKEFVLNNS
jgi:DNA-binding transcriptional LysR family regulator